MAVMNPLYTGKDSAAKFPELDALERSSARASELQVRGAEMKLDKALKDKERFQKMIDIDPIVAVSSANAARQASRLQEYNTKWAKRYADAKGELSFADEVEMANDKKLLQAEQGKILADQEQFQQAQQIIARDTRGYYDKNAFDKVRQQYFKTGELPPNILDVAPQRMEDYLSSISKDLPRTRQTVEEPMIVNGKPTGQKVYRDVEEVSLQDAQDAIITGMTDDAVLKGVLRDFENLPESEQLKIVGDYNGDGKVDPADNKYAYDSRKIPSNPIVQWAINNPKYLNRIMTPKEGVGKKVNTGQTSSSDWSTYFGAGKKTTYQATEARDVGVIGQTPYKTYHDIPNLPVDDVTVQTIRILDPKGEQTIQPKSPIPAEIVGYDEEKDEVIFIATKDFLNLGSNAKYGSGQQSGKDKRFAVKRSALSDRQKDIYILKDGKKVKIKDLPTTKGGTQKVDIGL